MKIYVLPLLFFVLSSVFLMVLPSVSLAAPSYSVAPLVIDTEVEARDIVKKQITITNTGSQPVTVYPTVNNIAVDEGGTIQEFLPPVESDRTTSLASWIEIRRSGIELPVGTSETVDLTLRINPNPEPGEYHAFIGFGSGRNSEIAKEQVRLGRAPGTVVTVTVLEDTHEFLKLSRFIIDRFVTSAENEGATYRITNPGDETLTPSGEIIFYDNRGVEVASLPVNEERLQIPAGEEKEFTVSVPTEGLFGKYKAFLSVEYGTAQLASVQDTTFFYVFPLKTVLILLGVISLCVVFASLYVHKRYLDDSVVDDSVVVPFRIKETASQAQEHDIDLKQQ